MTSDALKKILTACQQLDILASKLYTRISHKSHLVEAKQFWEEMALEEREHVFFWKNAIKFSMENTIPNIFEDDSSVINDLSESLKKAQILYESIEYNNDVASYFLTAYWMEFYLLYPSFSTIFHYMGILSEDNNPELKYESHLLKFVDGFSRFGKVTPEMELLGSILNSLWKRNHELVTMSMHDNLTKVYNRKGLNDLMQSYGSLAVRNNYSIAIVMIDIDNFKKVNDTYGHQVGDIVLIEVAKRLQANTRKSDILGRFGGEEFLLYASNIDQENLVSLASKLNLIVSDTAINDINITISIGCCIGKIEDQRNSIDKMIAMADEQLYIAKHGGKNTYRIASI